MAHGPTRMTGRRSAQRLSGSRPNGTTAGSLYFAVRYHEDFWKEIEDEAKSSRWGPTAFIAYWAWRDEHWPPPRAPYQPLLYRDT